MVYNKATLFILLSRRSSRRWLLAEVTSGIIDSVENQTTYVQTTVVVRSTRCGDSLTRVRYFRLAVKVWASVPWRKLILITRMIGQHTHHDQESEEGGEK